MTTTEVAPDGEFGVRAWLAAAFSPVHVATATPANLGDLLPFVEVSTVNGADVGVPLMETITLDVDVYAATLAAAMALAKQVQFQMALRMPGSTVAGESSGSVSFGHVRTTSLPAQRPWANTSVFRIGATYSVDVHGHL